MTTTISNCGHDERGKYSGGKAGDQGGEWVLKPWYNRPWNCVLRHPSAKVRAMIADMAKAAAENEFIGYDQDQRLTFWNQLRLCGYKPERIAKKCEADCSSGVAAIVKGAGYRLKDVKLQGVSPSIWTGNERAALVNAGFKVLTAKKYTEQSSYLFAGDILLNESAHTAINVTDGTKAGQTAQKPVTSETKPANGDFSAVAKAVYNGDYGNGAARVANLKAAGYTSAQVEEIQRLVNELAGGGEEKKDLAAVARHVARGDYGNGAARRKALKAAGYTSAEIAEIQKLVNELVS